MFVCLSLKPCNHCNCHPAFSLWLLQEAPADSYKPKCRRKLVELMNGWMCWDHIMDAFVQLRPYFIFYLSHAWNWRYSSSERIKVCDGNANKVWTKTKLVSVQVHFAVEVRKLRALTFQWLHLHETQELLIIASVWLWLDNVCAHAPHPSH